MARVAPARLSPAEGRRFGLVLGTAFLALAALLWWRARPLGAGVLMSVGAALLLAGLLVPSRLGPVRRAWMRLAVVISRVTTPVFLALVYYLVVTPMGLIMRLIGYRPLTRARRASTVWVARRPEQRRSDLRRQF
ncbi:MAG: hypothetical protein HY705_04755 [Gemmatimonadetes bacterium]|nr:hypothetical protein [Gemmatimonadota bacterium]